jgi:hypothetical protein
MTLARSLGLLALLSLSACASSEPDPESSGFRPGLPVDAGDRGRHPVDPDEDAGPALEPDHYRLDFDGRDGGALAIDGETVVLPLGLNSDPGDAMELYTRVGCVDDVDALLGADGRAEARLPPMLPVALSYVAVEQRLPDGTTAKELGEQTCFAYRSSNGRWQPSFHALRTVVERGTVRLETNLLVYDADALAIFLPSHTELTSIEYAATERE